MKPVTSLISMNLQLSREDLEVLKADFPNERLGVKVQSFNREKTKAMLVLYLQHTDVQDRIEVVDPAWSCEVLSEQKQGDTVYVRSRMILKGVARENVGEGSDPKSAYSDAIKRCAMLFGVGRYLYDSPLTWVNYDAARDRFKQWIYSDYENAQVKPGEHLPAPRSPEHRPSIKPRKQNPAA